VCAWVRTSDPNGQYILSFDRNEYYRLQINGDGSGPGRVGWQVMTINAGVEQQVDYGSVTRVDDGLWHHITGVFDRGRSTIFIDGIPEPSDVGGPTYGVGDLVRFGFIGANSEATEFNGSRGDGTGVTGDLSDVRIYDKALTQEEILQVMRTVPGMAWDLRPTNGRVTESRRGGFSARRLLRHRCRCSCKRRRFRHDWCVSRPPERHDLQTGRRLRLGPELLLAHRRSRLRRKPGYGQSPGCQCRRLSDCRWLRGLQRLSTRRDMEYLD